MHCIEERNVERAQGDRGIQRNRETLTTADAHTCTLQSGRFRVIIFRAAAEQCRSRHSQHFA